MTKYCNNCQKQLTNEAAFCPDCGCPAVIVNEPEPIAEPVAELIAEPAANTAAQPATEAVFTDEAAFQAPPQYAYAPPYVPAYERELYPPVSTGLYFILNILMAIPLVGFILSFILTLASSNKSLKNYAKAYLIGNLIIIALALICVICTLIFGTVLAENVFNML